jgi:hypothetical protein
VGVSVAAPLLRGGRSRVYAVALLLVSSAVRFCRCCLLVLLLIMFLVYGPFYY